MKKQNKIQLALALVLCFLSILLAGITQTRFGMIEMNELSIETDAGTLTGYLFRPKNATAENPAPCVIASHGYLNNREMQDANYVELARRGYVVISMNDYGHGDSDVAREELSQTPAVRSGGMIEFVYYAATLDFVDSARIGVTGHSMGGGYANTTMAHFTGLERALLAAGADAETAHAANLVNTGVIIGNYPDNIVTDTPHQGYLCNIGVIEGKYDEFFYDSANDLLTSEESKNLVLYHSGQPVVTDIKEGVFYTNEKNGYSIVLYNPPQFHATNHFSTKVVGYMLDAFEHSMPAPRTLPSSNQIWVLKEIFNLIGLIGFFLFVVPFTDLLLSLPFFKELRAEKEPAIETPARWGRYVWNNVGSGLICFLLIIPLLLLGYALLVNPVWPQDTTGGVGLWSVGCGLIALASVRRGFGKKIKPNKEELGLAIGKTAFRKTLLLALIVTACTFGLVFFADFVNQTDFRFWTFDIRVFDGAKAWVAVRYLPFFAVYYIFNSLAVSRSTFNDWSEGKQIAVCALWNVLAPALMLIITYLPTPFLNGTLWCGIFSGGGIMALLRTGMALIPILMIPFVPILAIAAAIGVRCYRMTGKIWLGALINTLLVTMITVANTSFSYPY